MSIASKHMKTNSTVSDVAITAFGEALVSSQYPEAAWRFDYGSVNTRLVTPITANGGSVTVSESKAVLATGTANNGEASIKTKKVLHYINGVGGLVRFTALYHPPTALLEQGVGIGDENDGYYIGFDGANFGVLRLRGGVSNWTYETNFNGLKPSSIGIDHTLGNVYAINFQWLGYGFIQFLILDPEAFDKRPINLYKRMHIIKYPNTSRLTSVLNPTLPLRAYIKNKGNTSNATLETPSGVVFLQGGTPSEVHPLEITESADTTVTFANTSNNHAITVQNKTIFNGSNNRAIVEIMSIDFSRGSGASLSTFRLYRNATTVGVLTYTDIDATNSPVSTSVTTTTISSTNAERSYSLPANLNKTITFASGELLLFPGDRITLGVQNNGTQSTDFQININWKVRL